MSGHYVQCPPGYVPVFIASEHYNQAMNYLAGLPSVKNRAPVAPQMNQVPSSHGVPPAVGDLGDLGRQHDLGMDRRGLTPDMGMPGPHPQ
ncbi:hypothetical protein KIPB_003185 [Kipferlia bialata]|uniref:Uncharacterized protein n=1 Tax=Kipferlia bialata TaxID=797122 RepID=A0A391NMW5_9EUKA|nr:hypothetical protein KIPB_003185 [Kipferlia bialata]|eukprot:g3185.t1